MRRLKKYSDILIWAIFAHALFYLGYIDCDFGDYAIQINNLLENNSFLKNGTILNRYPPVTSIIYWFSLTSLKWLSKNYAILIIHLVFALGIQLQFNYILNNWGYNREKNLFKTAIRSIVIFNPYIFSFMMRGANSELIFINFCLFAFICILKIKSKPTEKLHYFLLGTTIGLAMLTRSQGYALMISSLAAIAMLKFNYRFFISLLLIAAVIFPWQNFNAKYSNSFITSGIIPSFRDGLTYNNKKFRKPLPLPSSVDTFSRIFYKKYYSDVKQYHVQPKETELKFVFSYLKEHPNTAIELFLFKLARCFYGTDSHNRKFELINVLQISILLIVFFTAKNYLTRNQLSYNLLLSWLAIKTILTICMSILALSILRYQAPLIPFLLIIILMGIDKRWGKSPTS